MLRLDPAVRPLWRTPTALQFGLDPVIGVLDPAPDGVERLITALVDGVDAAGLHRIAREAGLGDADVEHVLAAVDPALRPPAAPPASAAQVAVIGPPDLTAALDVLLQPAHPASPDLVVIVAHHLVAPADTVRFLQEDRPHLAVVFGDQAAVVGPFVRPGVTPCLRCAEEHRLGDPARRAIAAQLLRRSTSCTGRSASTRLRATLLVAAAVDAVGAGQPTGLEGTELRLAPDGAVTRRPVRWHDRCSCRAAQPDPVP